jgi:hypothetical protein
VSQSGSSLKPGAYSLSNRKSILACYSNALRPTQHLYQSLPNKHINDQISFGQWVGVIKFDMASFGEDFENLKNKDK